jgi:hypothetical protein
MHYSSISLPELEEKYGEILFFASSDNNIFAKFADGTCLKRNRWFHFNEIGTDESGDNWQVVDGFIPRVHFESFFENRDDIQRMLHDVDYETFKLDAKRVSQLYFGPGSYDPRSVIDFEFVRKFNLAIPQFCNSCSFVDIEEGLVLHWYETGSGSVLDYQSTNRSNTFTLSVPEHRLREGRTLYGQLIQVGIIETDEFFVESTDLPMAFASVENLYPDVATPLTKKVRKGSNDPTRTPQFKKRKLERGANRQAKMQMHF